MIDFTPLANKTKKLSEIAAEASIDDLRATAIEGIDTMLGLIEGCVDADVTFVPVDPEANDTFASSSEDTSIAWTLGHVIVHALASSEEGIFLAAELARGVDFHGRSRSEVPWESVTSVAQCRQYLEQSRRMRLASLELWPDEPHYETKREVDFLGDSLDARGAFLMGLLHEKSHLGQIGEIVRQAKAARGA